MTKVKQQVTLFVTFAVLAVIIMLASILRVSHSQLDQKLGIAQPSPIIPGHTHTLVEVPIHGTYQLPYPGILPTHPLYGFKMVRDKLLVMTTGQPTDRAKLLLLLANKRMAAANILIEQGKTENAVTVATKGTEYLRQAIEIIPQLSTQQTNLYIPTLKESMLKHEEIIEKISANSTGGFKNQASVLYQRLDTYRQRLGDMTHQPFGLKRPEDHQSEELQEVKDALGQPSI